MKESALQVGPLGCTVIEPDGHKPKFLMFLCHGYGAGGGDLVPLARSLARKFPDIAFAMPQGPLDLSEMLYPGARAWWHINVGHVATAIASGRLAEIQNSIPEGLPEARRKLTSSIEALLIKYNLTYDKLLVSGFSQGAMLAIDVALSLEESPLALGVLSGTLICQKRWQGLLEKRTQLAIFQSHGKSDPILPFSNAEALKSLFEKQIKQFEFMSFNDQHTIPTEAVLNFCKFLSNLTL